MPRTAGLLALVIAAGAVGVVAHAELPIVRNSLVYARIADSMLEHGTAFSVAEHGYNKALGFPLLSLPAVAVFGANVGLRLSSFVWTSLWLVGCALFFRRLATSFRVGDRAPPSATLCVALLCCSPLVFAQFDSAYPDSLNALAFLGALYFLERASGRDARRWDGAGFAACLVASVFVKHHGFVLLALLPVFVACRWSVVTAQLRNEPRTFATSATALAAALAILGLAQAGWLPIFNLAQNRGNYGGGLDDLGNVVLANLRMLADFGWLSLWLLLPLALRWKGFAAHREWYLSLLVFTATILVYEGAPNNVRYFLPVAPLLVWIVANNLADLPRPARRAAVAAFLVANGFLTLYYNHLGFHELVREVHAFPARDNLRLTTEVAWRHQDIQAINAHVRPGRDVLFHDLPYYGGGGWYVWERAGLFDPRLRIVYLDGPDWPAVLRRAEQEGLREALYYGYLRRRTQARWAHAVEFQPLSRRAWALVFRRAGRGERP